MAMRLLLQCGVGAAQARSRMCEGGIGTEGEPAASASALASRTWSIGGFGDETQVDQGVGSCRRLGATACGDECRAGGCAARRTRWGPVGWAALNGPLWRAQVRKQGPCSRAQSSMASVRRPGTLPGMGLAPTPTLRATTVGMTGVTSDAFVATASFSTAPRSTALTPMGRAPTTMNGPYRPEAAIGGTATTRARVETTTDRRSMLSAGVEAPLREAREAVTISATGEIAG